MGLWGCLSSFFGTDDALRSLLPWRRCRSCPRSGFIIACDNHERRMRRTDDLLHKEYTLYRKDFIMTYTSRVDRVLVFTVIRSPHPSRLRRATFSTGEGFAERFSFMRCIPTNSNSKVGKRYFFVLHANKVKIPSGDVPSAAEIEFIFGTYSRYL